jgi:hypothetical protein
MNKIASNVFPLKTKYKEIVENTIATISENVFIK